MSRWREAVRCELARYYDETGDAVVTSDELYESVVPELSTLFPANDNPRAKFRQQLQMLRDDGAVEFLDDAGTYRLSFAAELSDSVVDVPADGRVERVTTVRDELNRDAALATQLKERYDHHCQLCGDRRVRDGAGTGYAECHHVRPLGRPHHGPDRAANLLVLCPNHHADFDHGVVRVDPDTFAVTHAGDRFERLSVADWHGLGPQFLRYHNANVSTV